MDPIRAWVKEFVPGLNPEPVRVALCADGYTPDDTGMLGTVPGMDGVVVAARFSGHGFKMASALGAVATDIVLEGTTVALDERLRRGAAVQRLRLIGRSPPRNTAL